MPVPSLNAKCSEETISGNMSDRIPLLQQFVDDPETAEILDLKEQLKQKLRW